MNTQNDKLIKLQKIFSEGIKTITQFEQDKASYVQELFGDITDDNVHGEYQSIRTKIQQSDMGEVVGRSALLQDYIKYINNVQEYADFVKFNKLFEGTLTTKEIKTLYVLVNFEKLNYSKQFSDLSITKLKNVIEQEIVYLQRSEKFLLQLKKSFAIDVGLVEKVKSIMKRDDAYYSEKTRLITYLRYVPQTIQNYYYWLSAQIQFLKEGRIDDFFDNEKYIAKKDNRMLSEIQEMINNKPIVVKNEQNRPISFKDMVSSHIKFSGLRPSFNLKTIILSFAILSSIATSEVFANNIITNNFRLEDKKSKGLIDFLTKDIKVSVNIIWEVNPTLSVPKEKAEQLIEQGVKISYVINKLSNTKKINVVVGNGNNTFSGVDAIYKPEDNTIYVNPEVVSNWAKDNVLSLILITTIAHETSHAIYYIENPEIMNNNNIVISWMDGKAKPKDREELQNTVFKWIKYGEETESKAMELNISLIKEIIKQKNDEEINEDTKQDIKLLEMVLKREENNLEKVRAGTYGKIRETGFNLINNLSKGL